MNINDLTLGQIKEIAALGFAKANESSPFAVGKAYLIRTVTMTWCGRVVSASSQFLTLEDSAWIADTGRFHQAVAVGASVLKEVEPVPGISIIGVGAVVDAVEWTHSLPLTVK